MLWFFCVWGCLRCIFFQRKYSMYSFSNENIPQLVVTKYSLRAIKKKKSNFDDLFVFGTGMSVFPSFRYCTEDPDNHSSVFLFNIWHCSSAFSSECCASVHTEFIIKAVRSIKEKTSNIHTALQKCIVHVSIVFHVKGINVHCIVLQGFFSPPPQKKLFGCYKNVHVRKNYCDILKVKLLPVTFLFVYLMG